MKTISFSGWKSSRAEDCRTQDDQFPAGVKTLGLGYLRLFVCQSALSCLQICCWKTLCATRSREPHVCQRGGPKWQHSMPWYKSGQILVWSSSGTPCCSGWFNSWALFYPLTSFHTRTHACTHTHIRCNKTSANRFTPLEHDSTQTQVTMTLVRYRLHTQQLHINWQCSSGCWRGPESHQLADALVEQHTRGLDTSGVRQNQSIRCEFSNKICPVVFILSLQSGFSVCNNDQVSLWVWSTWGQQEPWFLHN